MLSQSTIQQLEQRLTQLLDSCDVINAGLVATLDGYLCAMKQRHQHYSLERLATMGSTLMALGDTITAELQMGNCDNIISENKQGIIAFMHINDDFVLVTLSIHKNALGMLLSHSRRCAQEMVTIIKTNP